MCISVITDIPNELGIFDVKSVKNLMTTGLRAQLFKSVALGGNKTPLLEKLEEGDDQPDDVFKI
jgi:hypothetical protein